MSKNSPESGTDCPTVILHWALVITFIASLMTGLRISSDAKDAYWSRLLDPILLQGSVLKWHAWAALALSMISIAYIVFLYSSRLYYRVSVDRVRRNQLMAGDKQSFVRAGNIALYWMAFVLLLIGSFTGAIVYWFPDLLPWQYTVLVHRVVAWMLITYLVLHVFAQFILGGFKQLLKILNPRIAYTGAGIAALTVAGVVGAGIMVLDRNNIDLLPIARIGNIPVIDGNGSDPAWQSATPVTITTMAGQNQPESETPVTVRMLHDGEYIYSLFEWPDATRSQKHLPLIKTEEGWRVLQSEFATKDEDRYYEDKFGVMLSNSAEIGGGGSTQLGPKPLPNKPGPSGGRGLHYTTDNSLVDVWHWKSVRTGSSGMNQIDDNFFGPPLPTSSDKKKSRYTGGYGKDPKDGGGFSMNWESYSDSVVIPKRLPKNDLVLERVGELNLNPDASDFGQLWMRLEDTVPYSVEQDSYPVGTIIPSVLIEGPFTGDRGDVTAHSDWRDGKWSLEVQRKLDTGSEFDVAIDRSEDAVYLWVAVFNHSQTRHSRHLHPVKLILE